MASIWGTVQPARPALGGLHLDADSGGMMIPEAGQSEQDIHDFAQADLAVKSAA